MLEAVIFDVDGTLADTEEAHRRAFNETFREFELPWDWDPGLYRELLSVAGGKERLRHYCRACCPHWLERRDADEWLAELHRRKTQRYAEAIVSGEVAPRPGVVRLICELQRQGVRLAIATTTSRSNVEALLRGSLAAVPGDAFEVIGAGEQAREKKPSPTIYQWVVAQLGLAPGACLAIEDSENGVRSARDAGVPVVVTESRWSRGDDFSGSLAVVSDLGEPGAPCRLVAGDAAGMDVVDLALLKRWHESAR